MIDKWKPIYDWDGMIKIFETEKIFEFFDNNPSSSLTVLVPASGSWSETFWNKEQYIERQEAWNGGSETWSKYYLAHH